MDGLNVSVTAAPTGAMHAVILGAKRDHVLLLGHGLRKEFEAQEREASVPYTYETAPGSGLWRCVLSASPIGGWAGVDEPEVAA